ncbi:MAG: HlyD family efflux transporter periplasmic adaptor subunit [Flexistipes sinusarabici]|uniref:HlyD family efflux transporter periplasmic adaptor subunit n=1 Tax=Flexistipes sinusarabici TaxID=2352 RepID=A0A5D0MQN3_FLESI|nr:HlyD family efflux transporter periplasmic adaptor subunit [Flexistipes sinusarabici]TYB34902.1 MAG: HlyD family efflux transporter periplasmic adaptor subunit [Flexistipes sinusarabici]
MNKKVKIALGLLILGLILFGFVAYKWLKYREIYATTNAAFVRSEQISRINFKRVAGRISKIYVEEGQTVKKGDIIAEIDAEDYRLKKRGLIYKAKSLQKEISSIEYKISKIKNDMDINLEKVKKEKKALEAEKNALSANIEEVNARLAQVNKDYKRYRNLYQEGAVSENSFEDFATKLKVLKNKKDSLEYKLSSLDHKISTFKEKMQLIRENRKVISELKSKKESLKDRISSLQTEIEDTENLILYTKLTAPIQGVIGKKFANAGTVVDSETPIVSIADTRHIYVEVLLEETKIKGVDKGDKVHITSDANSAEKYEGVVKEIYPASAATYALIPRDITAGEFTEVAQRIPIKVSITDGDISLLRIGMGMDVEIKR